MPTIVRQIETVEGHIQKCEDALDRIERSLRLEVLTESKRTCLQESNAVKLRTLSKCFQRILDLQILALDSQYSQIVQSLLEEEKQLKKKLKSHEQELRALRKENWKSMVLSVIILGVVYISYTFFFQS